jgi:hypothetical protein
VVWQVLSVIIIDKSVETRLMQDVGLGAAQTALMRILRPVVKLMIHLGMPLQSFIEVLKATYVEVAEKHFAEEGRSLTDSQVSVLTGVHRKDVRRLRTEPLQAESLTPSLSMQVGMAWTSIAGLMDAEGTFLPLARRNAKLANGQGVQLGEKTFDDLVESLTSDVSATAVLKDMLRQNMVQELAPEVYKLSPTFFLSDEKLSDKIGLVSLHIQDRIEASVQNLISGKRMHTVTSVYSKGVSADSLARLITMFEQDSTKILNKLNVSVTQGEQTLLPDQPAMRMSCGFYIYSEPLNTR